MSLWGPAPSHQFEESIFHILIPQTVDDRVEEGCGNVVEKGHFLATDKESEPGLMYVMMQGIANMVNTVMWEVQVEKALIRPLAERIFMMVAKMLT